MTDTINLSPWIHELHSNRTPHKVEQNISTNFVIVGGGIAGMATAFFTLENTDKQVILLEAWRLAHGATGHNAGQVVDYFEKPFAEIVHEYGLKLAGEGQAAVSSGWDLLQHILDETKMEITFSKFMGYAGCTNLPQLISHLENKRLKVKAGLPIHKVRVSKQFKGAGHVMARYPNLCELVPQDEVFRLLETNDPKYIAVLQSQKGCLNSALFVEKLASYLISKYPSRFRIYEDSPVTTVELYSKHALLLVNNQIISCDNVVLCTNGFENLNITNKSGDGINKRFHDTVYGIVGYMAGYVEDKQHDPIAISYLPSTESDTSEGPYYYLTRRNHLSAGENKSLICIGGPEQVHREDSFKYHRLIDYPKKVDSQMKDFLNNSHSFTPKSQNFITYRWHGLMGYTKSGIRCVGPEPLNGVLLYNLGCNGIGILPSLFGGKKISDHLAHNKVSESIFDPIVQRRIHKSI